MSAFPGALLVQWWQRGPLAGTAQLAQDHCRCHCLHRKGREARSTRPRAPFRRFAYKVNDEMGELERGLRAGFKALEPGGRLAVITFHSLEDRVVKRWFKDRSSPPLRCRGGCRFGTPQVAAGSKTSLLGRSGLAPWNWPAIPVRAARRFVCWPRKRPRG